MATVLEAAPTGLALLDADGRILGATDGFSRVLGCEAAPVGRELHELLSTLDERVAIESAMEELRRGESVNLEAWCWRGSDSPAAVSLVAAPLALMEQPPVSYCVVRDITDQRLAEAEHARALSLHQATLRSMADGLLVVDPAGGVLSFNQRFIDMWQIPPFAAASGRDADLLNAVMHQLEDPLGFLQRVAEVYSNPEGSSSDEVRLLDGRVFDRWSEPQRLAGRSVGRVWTFRDVTESRHAAEALRESQSLLELFFSQSLDAFFFMMLDHPVPWGEDTDKEAALDYIFTHERITKVNGAMLAQFSAREEELLGRTPAELLAHDIPGARARWREFLDTGHLHRETDERTLDGREMTIEGDYICLYDRQNRIIGHFGIQRDVTGRRQAENDLLRSRQELRDLTARLQLIREEERTFLAREVHDELGQALTGLKMDLAWLKPMVGDRPALAQRVQSIIVRIDGAIDTVRRIATNLRPSVLDDLGLVAAVEWQTQEFGRTTGIIAHLDVKATHLELDDVCATTTFRILQETLTNVARHAQATRVDIALRLGAEELMLEVNDNGRGITEGQLASPRSLGLIGSRERAIACGGELEIRGVRGQGTTVMLKIPQRATVGLS